MKKVKTGFTLIETLFYIAIISGIFLTFLSFIQAIMNTRNKVYVIQEVQSSARTALGIVEEKIRSATSINIGSSVFDADPGIISLVMSSSTINPTVISLTADDGSLQIQEGGGAQEIITSDNVFITQLMFTHLGSSTEHDNIRIRMITEYNTEAEGVFFEYTFPVTSTVTIRE